MFFDKGISRNLSAYQPPYSLPKTVEFFPVSFERNSRNLRVRINTIRFIFFEADVRPFEIRITV